MKIGDLVKYRSRRSDDPPKKGSSREVYCWNQIGVVVTMLSSRFKEIYCEPAVEYMCEKGDFHVARKKDLELLSES
jgi:hypothetical protein